MWITIEPKDGPARVVETGDSIVVGRRAECDLVLEDSQVSGRHAEIQSVPGTGMVVRDLGSTNGTRVAGVRIEGPATLTGGEEVRVGETVLRPSATDPKLAPPPPAGGAAVAAAAGAGAAAAGAQAAGAQPVAGAPAAGAPLPPPPPSASRIERLRLARTANRALFLAGGAVLVAAIAVILAVTGVFSSSKEKPTVAQVVKAITPSTLLIIGERNGEPVEKGTGWVLDADQGLVVTNNHVVQGGETLKVGVGTSGGKPLSERVAKIVGAAPCEDIAVIKVTPTDGLRTLPLGSQSKLTEGDGVVALGFPANASFRDNLVATSGVVSTVRTVFEAGSDVPSLPNVIQTDAATNPGNSGGPLVNFDKKLVGMNTAGFTAAGGRVIQGQGYAVGVDRIKQIVARLRQGHSIGWAGLGLSFPDPEKLRQAGAPEGLLVTHTESGSPASRIAELNQGTVLLVGINGRRLGTTLRSYCAAVRDIAPGRTAPITFLDNNGQLRTATLPFS